MPSAANVALANALPFPSPLKPDTALGGLSTSIIGGAKYCVFFSTILIAETIPVTLSGNLSSNNCWSLTKSFLFRIKSKLLLELMSPNAPCLIAHSS